MPDFMIAGIPVNFPFQPYDVQKAYMEKVIQCLQNSTNGILESPTGTGKTLSLLCSSLAWVSIKKAQVQAEAAAYKEPVESELTKSLNFINKLNKVAGSQGGAAWGVPKIIYASRTHSQLSQAMQELKNSSYNHVKAVIIGSRDQLCINPDVMKEINNSSKIQMCKLKVVTRTCTFHRNVENRKDHPDFRESHVMDIEDLVTTGRKLMACPYFVSKELVQNADIIFMPYNYLLDPKARRANKIDLTNTIIILDEAHNVEKMCEDSASIQLKSSDIASCIDDLTHVMKDMTKNSDIGLETGNDVKRDFTIDDLALLKEMLLNLEKTVDEVEVPKPQDGATFPGSYMFELLKKANITSENQNPLRILLDNLVQFLTTVSETNSYVKRGTGFELISDLLAIVFSELDESYQKRIHQCFKVHIDLEESKTKTVKKVDSWFSSTTSIKKEAKIISYWCFSPGFGMNQLSNKNIRSIILTSGTLAPLKPLITELGIPVGEKLENPHIIQKSQICVKIVGVGPDREILNSCFDNRNNPKYIASLGRTILSFSQIVPHGMLIFFPSYPVLLKCQDSWQASGLWSQISNIKPIYVESRTKEAFLNTMTEFYGKINDPVVKGAIFMAVCRGKVSEGLDFADMNGRAVLITGLPFPPLKDPRVILKKRYLQENRTKENEMLSGDDWYVLEASRAVNQAIGRVIRHKDDYGAILLCDSRFNNPRQKNQLSKWIQEHLNSATTHQNFGPIIGEVSRFFRNAERTLPQPGLKPLRLEDDYVPSEMKFNLQDNNASSSGVIIPKHGYETMNKIKDEHHASEPSASTIWNSMNLKNIAVKDEKPKDFFSSLNTEVSSIDFNDVSEYQPQYSSVKIHKRERHLDEIDLTNLDAKKKKFKIIPNTQTTSTITTADIIDKPVPMDRSELLKLIRSSIPKIEYKSFLISITAYQKECNFDELFRTLELIFKTRELFYLFKGMHRFIKDQHKPKFFEKLETIEKIFIRK